MKYRSLLCASISALTLYAGSIEGSQVQLNNGDAIHGEVVCMECGTMTLCSPCVGKVCICCDNIAAIEMDEVMCITLTDGRKIEGTIQSSGQDGKVLVVDACSEEGCVVDVCCICGIKRPCEPCPPKGYYTDGWGGDWSLGYSNLSGNSESESLSIDLAFKKVWKLNDCPHHSWRLYAEQRYEEDWKERDHVNKGKYGAVYEQWFTKRWSWFVWEEGRYDQEKHLKLKLDSELGLGYYVVQNSCINWQLQAGVALIDAFYKHHDDDEHTFNLPVGWDFCWKVWRELTFHQNTEYFPAVTDPNDFWWDNIFEVRFPLSCCGNWKLGIKYELDYHSKPPDKKKKNDSTFDIKLVYCF